MVNAITAEYNFEIITSRPRPFEIYEFTFKNEIKYKVISAGSNLIC
jgi:hypothetical protein